MITSFMLGFAGSFHCVGMCGPIALILPVQQLSGIRKLAGVLLYNIGRISAYALLGLIFGWLGQQLYLGGLQQSLSVLTSRLLVTVVVIKYAGCPWVKKAGQLNFLSGKIKQLLGAFLRQQRFEGLYLIGFLNGLLPCGIVYLGIAGAVSAGAVIKGILFMIAFGAGTLPAMLALIWFGHLFSYSLRNKIRKLAPALACLMGILLILRGLNLGIPYISPNMFTNPKNAVENCCHKP
ncbi:sulfite exporter TauE/SafE family protein [Chitinophaga sp. 30R24]|uniref:sulfite exporter TauE/SafE family protein n=1 Tax=Chitinophaga sp. 30R24 TaxID=3248838 RepID=UPI003B91A103